MTANQHVNESAKWFWLVLAMVCAPLWALDLSEAYRLAAQQDATIRAARATNEARRERLPQAKSHLLPAVSATVSRYRNSLERTSNNFLGLPVTTDERYTAKSDVLTIRQPLYRPALWADYRQAQAQVDDANAVLDRESQELVTRTAIAYFEALLAEEQLALVLAQKTSLAAQLDSSQKRLNAGAGTRTDIDEATAALDMNTAQELEARQAIDLSRRQLQSLINRPVDSLAALDPLKMQLARPVPDRVEAWTELAQASSPEARSFRAQLEAARHEVEKAQANHFPTLDAIAQWARSDSDTVSTVRNHYTQKSIGLQLTIPLYLGGYVQSTVRQALATQLRAEENLEALRRDIGVRVHREFRAVTEGVLRIKALEQAVRSADQVVISNRRAFEAGSRTLPDALNAEQQKVSAERDLAHARFVYLVSRVKLQALVGGPATGVIDEINGWLRN